ncbi:MAG: putative DNA binding domain-containing protein [Gammaproteobacteria bacterium]|nr:putative DNA binding domain-containing protein [Gammaproteobacteria bacterium]
MNTEYYPEREGKTLEFKVKSPHFASLIKTCVAFANGVGGQIIIGIDDENRKIVGITDIERDKLFENFPNSLYDSTTPNLFAQMYEKNCGEHSVLIIEVPYGLKKPYFVKREGLPNGVYLRIGSSTRRTNQETVEELYREGRRITFDEEPLQQKLEILSQELLKGFYGTHPTKNRLLADKIITQSGSSIERYYPTVAGALMFSEAPHQYLPEALVICTRFGSGNREIIQTEEIVGALPIQIEQSFALIYSWLERDFSLQTTQLLGRGLIPKDALREAIINALIHRKYSTPGAVKIAVYKDRLEIFNPGGFPGLVNINHLGDGTTYLRNPVLARLARKMRLVEKLGTGIRLIFDSCKKQGIKTPSYHEDGDFVKIRFYFEPSKNTKSTSGSDAILKLIELRNELTIKDVMNYCDISRNTATRRLNQLIKGKELVRYGKGPSVKFIKA